MKPGYVGIIRQTISWECAVSIDAIPAWSLPAKRTYTHCGRNFSVGKSIWHMKYMSMFVTVAFSMITI